MNGLELAELNQEGPFPKPFRLNPCQNPPTATRDALAATRTHQISSIPAATIPTDHPARLRDFTERVRTLNIPVLRDPVSGQEFGDVNLVVQENARMALVKED